MCEHFSHQSSFSAKAKFGGLIDSDEFCEICTIKECSIRLVFLGSKLTELFEVFQWDHSGVSFVLWGPCPPSQVLKILIHSV